MSTTPKNLTLRRPYRAAEKALFLAEFIVAQALGLTNPTRTEWAEYDLLWGIKASLLR